jgi:hypothetical protein
MKKIKLVFKILILLLTLHSISSCTTAVDPLDPTIIHPVINSTFKVNFNGQTWNASSTQAVVNPNFIIIKGIKGTQNENFQIAIHGTTIGTYSGETNIMAYSPPASNFGYSSAVIGSVNSYPGYVKITAIDAVNKLISGTFTFKGIWSNTSANPPVLPIYFSSGIFTNIPYSVNLNVVEDTFFAKVNGTEFVDTSIVKAAMTVNGLNSTALNALDANQNKIAITFDDDLVVGTTYTNSTNPLDDKFHIKYYGALGTVPFSTAPNATLKITQRTAVRVKGSFTFDCSDPATPLVITNVTEGTFDIEIP